MKNLFCIGLILLCLACGSDPQKEMEKKNAQELAKQLGVDAEGTKKEIAARCAAVEVDIPDNSELTEEDKKVEAENVQQF